MGFFGGFEGVSFALRTSEDKLKFGALLSQPNCLMYIIETRMIPHYRVFYRLSLITSKRLLQKEQSFVYLLNLSEEKFLGKFMSSFTYDDAEELLVIFKVDFFGLLTLQWNKNCERFVHSYFWQS